MNSNFVFYVLVGILTIWAVPKPPFMKWVAAKWLFFKELFECPFCLGFWVYLALSFVFNLQIEFIPNIPLVSNILIALVTSFVVYLMIEGWKSRFTVLYVG